MERLAQEAQQKQMQGTLESASENERPPKAEKNSASKQKKMTKGNPALNSSTEKDDKKGKKKGQKLYCICRTPYDKSK
jgi:hypothetical protein